MAWFVEWALFTTLASALLYIGYTHPVPGEKLLRLGVSFLFWIASLSQWITDHPGGSIVPMLAMIAPTIMSLIWTLQAMGDTTDKGYKRDIY